MCPDIRAEVGIMDSLSFSFVGGSGMSVIVCPSGLSLGLRGLKGKEVKALSDRAALKKGTFFDKILSACTVEVVAPGPYSTAEDGALNWGDVLIGDRMYTLIQIRIATFGEQFLFKSQCGSCNAKSEYEIDLNDLEVQRLAPVDLKAFVDGNRLSTKVPGSGAAVLFRLPTGNDERRAVLNREKDKAIPLQTLVSQIISIEGVQDVAKYLDELALSDVVALLKQLQTRDCGVETEIELECPECEAKRDIELPLGRAFWLTL